MTMFWNGKRAVLTSKKGGTACVRVLTAASVAAFALSFISPANSQPPDVKRLTQPESLRFQNFLTNEGYNKVQFVAIAYEDPQGGEKLIILKFQGPNPSPPAQVQPLAQASSDPLRIPGVASGSNFKAVILYTGSPASGTSCSSSAGTISCRF